MRYLGGGGQTGDFMSSFIRIPTFESFNLSFIKFLNSAELVRDTCIKTWIQDTQSSELPKNISICTFCAVHEAGVSVVENHDQSAILSVSSVAAVLHYECGRSAAPLQPQSAWPGYSSTVLGNVILLFTFTMVAPESLQCQKQKSAPCWCRGWCGQLVLSWGPPGPHLRPQPRPHPRYLLGSLHAEINITSLKIIILSPVRCIV